jgi:hypothetical protein
LILNLNRRENFPHHLNSQNRRPERDFYLSRRKVKG